MISPKNCSSLRLIYNAVTEEEASLNLANFREKWDNRYQSIGKSWEANWTKIVTCFAYPADIRRAVYTTNAIESVNMNLRTEFSYERNPFTQNF